MPDSSDLEPTSTLPMQRVTLLRFLNDDVFWNSARFSGVLCDDKGNPIPMEAEIPSGYSGAYVLTGTVELTSAKIGVREFFERWEKALKA